MFGIGFAEIILIGLVLIMVVKPEDFPKFIRNAGNLWGKAKKFYNEIVIVKDKILKEVEDVANIANPTSSTSINTPPKSPVAKAVEHLKKAEPRLPPPVSSAPPPPPSPAASAAPPPPPAPTRPVTPTPAPSPDSPSPDAPLAETAALTPSSEE